MGYGMGCGLWAMGCELRGGLWAKEWAVGWATWAMGCVPYARDSGGEAGEEGRAVGLGELQQVAGQDLRHASHLEGR